MAKKNTIRLTESELKRVVSESVKKVLKEDLTYPSPRETEEDELQYDYVKTYNEMVLPFFYKRIGSMVESLFTNLPKWVEPYLNENGADAGLVEDIARSVEQNVCRILYK